MSIITLMTEKTTKYFNVMDAYFTFYSDGSATLTKPTTYEISTVETVQQYKKKNGRHATRTITTIQERDTGDVVINGIKNENEQGFLFKS